MAKKKGRRSFTAEYKADVVRLCRAGDRSIGQVARDLGLTETSVRITQRLFCKLSEAAAPYAPSTVR